MKKTAIIGGGASGLFCAIMLLQGNSANNVTIFEKMNRVGKKILATGNGRCNITNENADKIERFYGETPLFPKEILSEFTPKNLIDYLLKNGLLLRKENDKYYPFSEQAGTVLDFLRLKCESLGARILVDKKIEKIKKSNNKFIIEGQEFENVVIACGGKSSPHLGSDGSGYELLKSFNHAITPLLPAITQIKTENQFTKQLKGIKADANVSIFVNQKLIREDFGQVLFADYGISGPPAFQLSAIAAKNYDKNCFLSLDFMPDFSTEQVKEQIYTAINNPITSPLKVENLLTLLLNKRLGQVIVKSCDININQNVYELSDKKITQIAERIKNFRLKVTGVNGFNNAQITYGGAKCNEFDSKTLESKFQKNLYSCGEILDVNGDCGGFNLQWAFASAFAVAKAINGENND